MGIQDRKDRDKEEMKKLILQAAKEISLEEGFDKLSIRKIADKIEYSPGSIYSYFKNMDEIIFELHNHAFEKFYKEQIKINDIKDPFEKLREHGKIYIRFGLENPDLYEIMFIVKAPGNEIESTNEWEKGMKTFDFLKQNIQECIDAGYFKGSDLNSISIAMWSLVHGIVSLYLRKRFAMIPKDYLIPVMNGAFDSMINNMKHKG